MLKVPFEGSKRLCITETTHNNVPDVLRTTTYNTKFDGMLHFAV